MVHMSAKLNKADQATPGDHYILLRKKVSCSTCIVVGSRRDAGLAFNRSS